MQAHCSSRNILWPPPETARKKTLNHAFLALLARFLDGNVGCVGRYDLTERTVSHQNPEAHVASVAKSTNIEGKKFLKPARAAELRRKNQDGKVPCGCGSRDLNRAP
jgi:hypothetical protein